MGAVLNLFPGIEDVDELYRDGKVEGHDVAYHYVSGPTRWVGKPGTRQNFLAESLAALFAEQIQAPVLDCRVGTFEGERIWLSSYVEFAGHWDFDIKTCYQVANLHELGRILALDVLVHNPDRHIKNVLVKAASDGGYDVMGIDFGKAHLAMPGIFEVANPLPINGIYRTIPEKFLRGEAIESAQKLADLDARAVRRIVQGATSTAKMDGVQQDVYDLCVARLGNLTTLTKQFLSQLP